jgi:PPP family 3-phenylpropionic acid transporter
MSFRLSCFYAAVFALVGVQLPFWPVWLASRGLDAREIALLAAAGLWVKVLANPLAGVASDRLGRRRVMVALAAATLIFFLLFLPKSGFAAYLAVSLLTGAAFSALTPLGDNLAITLAYSAGLDYGRIRLWGSLSFIAASLAAGLVLEAAAPDFVLVLVLAAAAMLLAAVLRLPDSPGPRRAARAAPLALLRDPALLLFLASAALVQASHAVYYAFGSLYWRELGYSSGVIGALWAEGVVAEIVLFALSAPLVRRVSPPLLLAIAGTAGLLRWAATAFAVALPALALLQLLHAFTFGAAHLGAMHFLARAVPAELSGSGQALYSAISGLGFGVAMLAAGALFAAHGGGAYLAMAAMAGAGAAGAAALALRWRALPDAAAAR